MSLMDYFCDDYSDSVESVNTSHHAKVKKVIANTFELYAQDRNGVFTWNVVIPKHFDADTYAKLQATKRFLKSLNLYYMSNLCDTIKYNGGKGVDYCMDVPIFDDIVKDGVVEKFDLLSEMFDDWSHFPLEDHKRLKIDIADHNDAFAKVVGFCMIMKERKPTIQIVEDSSNPGIGEAEFKPVLNKLNIIDNDPQFERILKQFPDYSSMPSLFNDKELDPTATVKDTILKPSGFSGNGNDILVVGKNLCGNKNMDYFFIGEISPLYTYGFEWVYPLPYSKSYKYVVGKLSPKGEEITGASLLSRLYVFRLSLWHSDYNSKMVKKYVLPLNINVPKALTYAIKECHFERRVKAIDLLGMSVNPDAISSLAKHGYFDISPPFTNFFIDKGVSKFKTLQYFLNRNGGHHQILLGAEKELNVDDDYKDIALAIASEYKVTPPAAISTPKSARLSSNDIDSLVNAELERRGAENKNKKVVNDNKKSKNFKTTNNKRDDKSKKFVEDKQDDEEPRQERGRRDYTPRSFRGRRNVQVRRPTGKKY